MAGFSPCKHCTRIEWNPAEKPGPVDVERVGLFASGSELEPGPGSGSGSGPGNNVGNDEDGMPRYAGYRAELRSLEIGGRGRGLRRRRARAKPGDTYPRCTTTTTNSSPDGNARRENTSKCITYGGERTVPPKYVIISTGDTGIPRPREEFDQNVSRYSLRYAR